MFFGVHPRHPLDRIRWGTFGWYSCSADFHFHREIRLPGVRSHGSMAPHFDGYHSVLISGYRLVMSLNPTQTLLSGACWASVSSVPSFGALFVVVVVLAAPDDASP
jgi:hypothetical protein